MPFPNENTQFRPGRSGNPIGSSKKQRFTNALVKRLDEQDLDDPFIKAGLEMALDGDFNFWKYIYERIEGKVPDPEPPKPDLDMGQVLNMPDKPERESFD